MSTSTKGQTNRKRIMGEMINKLPEYEGFLYDNTILELAYEFNLAPDTIKYSYMQIFIQRKIISLDEKYMIHIGKEYKPLPEMKPYLDAKKKLAEEKTG
jgi:hypothetical protein